MRKLALLCPAVLLAALAIGAPQALAATDTYNVAAGGADAAGSCTGSAPTFTCANLRKAVEAANADASPPALIQLKSGSYALTLGVIKVTQSVNMAGTTSGARSVIERPSGEGPLMEVASAAALTMTSAQAGGPFRVAPNRRPGKARSQAACWSIAGH